jgi:hypothetical protein
MQSKSLHEVGKRYSREVIRKQNAADNINDVYYLQHAGGKVVALCLRQDTNHEAPAQVWVGAGPKVAAWGERLAKPGLKLPVYIRPGGAGDFTFYGWHEVTARKHTAAELKAAMARPGVGALSRIVFLSGPHPA